MVFRRPTLTVIVGILLLTIAGCGEEKGMSVDWDLSKQHTRAEVTWPDDAEESYTASLEPVESARIRLPAGKALDIPDRLNDIILYRRSQGPEPLPGPEGEVLDKLEVYSKPLGVEEAYRRALEYADRFDLPRAPLERWRERREKGAEDATDRTATTIVDRPIGGKGGPIPNVELLYSANDQKPWVVMVQFYWPPEG